jgi:hypothetical protein
MKGVSVPRFVTACAMLACGATALGAVAHGQTATLPASAIPDLVTVPNGVNLGSTSFYDGFSTMKPGVAVLQYLRYNDSNKIADKNGNDNPLFQNPQIDAVTSVTQFSVGTPWAINGNRVGFDLLVPVTYINGKFGPGGMQLRDNGTGIGDITFGPYLQFKPLMMQGHPVLSVRVAVDVAAPTGKFDRTRDLNQGSGYWSINPYVAWTLLPAPKWEISGRTQYLYSLDTSKISNPPAIPGFTFRNGQAGQLLWTNFDISREVTRGVAIGVNGFAVKQITNDRINGISLPDTKRSAVYVGPGLHIDRMPNFTLNANLYLPVSTRLYATGPQMNLQLIVPLKLGAGGH